MKTRIFIGVLVLMMAMPCVSYGGSGFFRYVFDAISNQLGLDRGPIPKTPNRRSLCAPFFGDPGRNAHRTTHRIRIQAEGF